jgi:phosphate-selective porin OprO and OprP
MKFSKLTVAIAATLGASASFSALAMDLYVDTKTKQIYAEPGKGRELMGAFERISDKPLIAPATTADVAELSSVKEDLATKSNEIKALQEHMDQAETVKVTMDKKGLQVQSADKNFKFKLGGRLQTDATYNTDEGYYTNTPLPVDANDGTELRRARMRFEGVFYRDWLTRIEVDFGDNEVAVKDAFLEYNGFNFLRVTAGQQKQNFSRELQESSNDIMFTERSLMNILAAPTVDRAIGLNLESTGKNWVAKAGVYGNSITPNLQNGSGNAGTGGDEGWAINSRLIYNPILAKDKLIHLGIAGNYREADDTGYSAKGNKYLNFVYETTNMSNLRLINSTPITNLESISMLGLEAAGMWGPGSIGGEYSSMWVNRSGGPTNGSAIQVDGWYAEAAWTLTGESRKYSQGNFRYLDPAKPFDLKNGGWGAVEAAVRYSGADLNDVNYNGGNIQNMTLAVNWYLNSNIRLMADWTSVVDLNSPVVSTVANSKSSSSNSNLGTDSFWLRAQIAY